MTEITRGEIIRVGADLAKRVIQVHAVDAAGRVVVARALPREKFTARCAQLPPPGCLIAMEACGAVPTTWRAGCKRWALMRGSLRLTSSAPTVCKTKTARTMPTM